MIEAPSREDLLVAGEVQAQIEEAQRVSKELFSQAIKEDIQRRGFTNPDQYNQLSDSEIQDFIDTVENRVRELISQMEKNREIPKGLAETTKAKEFTNKKLRAQLNEMLAKFGARTIPGSDRNSDRSAQ